MENRCVWETHSKKDERWIFPKMKCTFGYGLGFVLYNFEWWTKFSCRSYCFCIWCSWTENSICIVKKNTSSPFMLCEILNEYLLIFDFENWSNPSEEKGSILGLYFSHSRVARFLWFYQGEVSTFCASSQFIIRIHNTDNTKPFILLFKTQTLWPEN